MTDQTDFIYISSYDLKMSVYERHIFVYITGVWEILKGCLIALEVLGYVKKKIIITKHNIVGNGALDIIIATSRDG